MFEEKSLSPRFFDETLSPRRKTWLKKEYGPTMYVLVDARMARDVNHVGAPNPTGGI